MNLDQLKSFLEEKGFLASFVEETGYTMFEGNKFDIYVSQESISIITHEQVILGIEEPIVDVLNTFETEEEFIYEFLSSHFQDDDDVSDVLEINPVKPQLPVYFEFLNLLKEEEPTTENSNCHLTFKIKNNGWIWVDNDDTDRQISKNWNDEPDFYQAISSISKKQSGSPSPYVYSLSFTFLNNGYIVRVYSLISKELVNLDNIKMTDKRINPNDFETAVSPLVFVRDNSGSGDSFIKLYYDNTKEKSGFPLYVMTEERVY